MVKSRKFSWQRVVWIGTALCVLFCAAFGWQNGTTPTVRQFSRIQIGEQEFQVVVSETPRQTEQGLSGRRRIGADGMLFVFAQRHQPTFWMYRMRFALDFVWIDGDRIVQLDRDVTPPVSFSTPTSAIATVRPEQPVTAVLEVPSGFIEKHQLEQGETFRVIGEPSLGAW